MNVSESTPSADAAELVLQERERQKEAQRVAQKRSPSSPTGGTTQSPTKSTEVKLETVSVPKWEGAEQGEVDESELDRRQRAISEKLERKQREVIQQGKQLAKVRAELKALEVPIKQEIMNIRELLEGANKEEIYLVQSVNTLRKDLAEKEKSLDKVRSQKQDYADQLIKVMADYEKRKTERLNEIAQLVGVDEGGEGSNNVVSKSSSSFAGF